jgi:nucleotide sugar dehydrogenase
MVTHDILKLDIEQIKEIIDKNELTVCVVGIGRIGLPTALSFAKSGLRTIGVDINQQLVDQINSGNYPLLDEPGYDLIFKDVINDKLFSATSKIEEAVPESDVILLSLPTPMDEQNIPDYSALLSVASQLSKLIKKNSIIVVESTIEPGFIENDLIKILESSESHFKAGVDFSIGACPETANPGEILKDFSTLPRLVGGINKKTSEIIFQIYSHVFEVELIMMPNPKTANAVKLTTNVFRDLNIAFVNELSILFEKLGIDTFTVLESAKRKYNFQIHYPGAGVGGPCLPVNSYQFLNSAKNFNLLKIVEEGRKINEKMPQHVVDLTKLALEDSGMTLNKTKVLILGVSYKPNVKDIQISPAEKIIKLLEIQGAEILIYDPYYVNSQVYGYSVENSLSSAIEKSDVIVLVTAHDEFSDLKLQYIKNNMKNAILIDTRGIFDPNEAKNLNINFRGLGRGTL